MPAAVWRTASKLFFTETLEDRPLAASVLGSTTTLMRWPPVPLAGVTLIQGTDGVAAVQAQVEGPSASTEKVPPPEASSRRAGRNETWQSVATRSDP